MKHTCTSIYATELLILLNNRSLSRNYTMYLMGLRLQGQCNLL